MLRFTDLPGFTYCNFMLILVIGFQAQLCLQSSDIVLYFHRKYWIYSKCDWNPCPPLIFQLMHQSFRLNKLAGLRTPLIRHTPKHISLPQYELFNELFIILDWSCAQRTSSINNELPAPLRGLGKALRIIELWFEGFEASPSISLYWDKCSWPQWWMQTEAFFVCCQSLIRTTRSKDVGVYFRRAEFYCHKYDFSQAVKNNQMCNDEGHLCWIWKAQFIKADCGVVSLSLFTVSNGRGCVDIRHSAAALNL